MPNKGGNRTPSAEEAARIKEEERGREPTIEAERFAEAERVRLNNGLRLSSLRLSNAADAERIEAEERAAAEEALAEAESCVGTSLRDDAAATTEDELPVVPDDNLLEIPVSAEVVAYRDNSGVDESDLAAVLEELEKAEREAARTERS